MDRSFLGAYCERADLPGLFAEPLNAVTNIAFLIAAILIWRRLAESPLLGFKNGWDVVLLSSIVFVIGVGSGAWHLWPMRATLLADVIPISLFIHIYLVAFSIRVLGLAWYWAGLILLAFIAAGYAFPALVSMQSVGSTLAYFPAYVTLAIMTVVLFAIGNSHRRALAVVLATWTVSLGLRAIDGTVCASFPVGTHFLWHMLNATVLYGLLRILIASGEERLSSARPEAPQ